MTEKGSVTVLGAAILTVIGVTMALVAAAFATGWDVIRTRNTVDLAAISAAQIVADGGSAAEACSAASTVAQDLAVDCRVDGEVVTLSAEKDAKFLWITKTISARAIAGPAREHFRSLPR